MRFATGRIVLHRNFHGDRLALLKTAIVVEDSEAGLLLWVPRDTPMLDRRTVDDRGLRAVAFSEWVVSETKLWPASWRGEPVLKWLPTGAAHSVWWFRDAEGGFKGWYVNLEESGVRWDDGDVAGVDIVDQDLDLWVTPDRAWSWKDEEEFAERYAFGEPYWVGDEAAVRAEGERVVKLIEAGRFPFDGTWCDFRPDADWRPPVMVPPGWERPRAR